MRRFGLVVFSLVLLGDLANAQVPSGNVFFGYSFYNTDLSQIGRVNTNGWEASVEGKIIPFLGIVADFDSHYGSQTFTSLCPGVGCPLTLSADLTEHNYLFGPRVSISVSRFRPFAEALIGAGHVSVNDSVGSNTSFASALGGGLDYKLLGPVAWRLQGDYVHTHFFGLGENNVRISTGVVLRF